MYDTFCTKNCMNSDKPVENFKVILEKWNNYNLYMCVLKFYIEANHTIINTLLLNFSV